MAFKSAIEHVEAWNKELNAGDMLEGYFVKKECVKGKFGEQNKYIIEKDDKTRMAVYGSASIVPQFDNVPLGCRVRVTYKGEENSKNGRPVKVYEVLFDDTDKMPLN